MNPSRWVSAVGVLWSLTVLLIAGWWAWLLVEQSNRIAWLESQLGVSGTQALSGNLRMIMWEGAAFLLLLLSLSALLFWFYWRDHRRTRALRDFWASVTHELKTPLTSIRLQAECLTESVKDEKVQRVLEDTARLQDQVERLLELARVEGKGKILNSEISLKEWLDPFLRQWEETYRGKVKILNQTQDQRVLGDTHAVQVVIKNLIENSVRHSGQQPVQITITSRQEGDSVILEMKDNGAERQDLPQDVGVLFSKGPRSRGAGVGLYLVGKLMHHMGGEVVFHRGPGFCTSLKFQGAP